MIGTPAIKISFAINDYESIKLKSSTIKNKISINKLYIL